MTIFILASGVDPKYQFASTDKNHGAFGFLNDEIILVVLLCFGPAAGFFGNAGYVVSLLFFSPVIVSACFLFEPFISQMIGYWLDIDLLPGWLTWVGTSLVFLGILGIQKADRMRKIDTSKQETAQKKVVAELAETLPSPAKQSATEDAN